MKSLKARFERHATPLVRFTRASQGTQLRFWSEWKGRGGITLTHEKRRRTHGTRETSSSYFENLSTQ